MTFNPAETSISTLTVGGGMTVGGSSGNPGLLSFNLGNNSVDTIAASGALTVNAGGAIVGLNQLPGTAIAIGTYNLVSFSSGTGLADLTFAGGATTLYQNGETFRLASTTGAEQLSVIAPPAYAYWTGAKARRGAHWPPAPTPIGPARHSGRIPTPFPPATRTSSLRPQAPSNYAATTLDANYTIGSLTFSNSGAWGSPPVRPQPAP